MSGRERPIQDAGHHGDTPHRNPTQNYNEKLQHDSHKGPPNTSKAASGEGSGPPNLKKPTGSGEGSGPPTIKKPTGSGEGSGPPITSTNPPGEGSGPPGEGTGPPGGGGHHEKTPPVIFIPPWRPTYPIPPLVPPPGEKNPITPTTETPPPTEKTPQLPALLSTPPVIPEERSLTKSITVTNPKPKDPGVVPPPPTGVFTGKGGDGPEMERRFKNLYSSGKYSAHAGEESLTSSSIGLNHVKIDMVGTGAEMHQTKHLTDMVPPRDPFHLGEWKHDIPGKTVIAGHVSFKGTPGPLYELRNLGVHNGVPDQVTLEGKDGKKHTYEFGGREIIKDPKDQKTWNKVFAPGDPEHKQLVLVTCCGPVNSHGLHAWRLIDYLHEVKSPAASGTVTKLDNAVDTKGAQKVDIKFADHMNPLTPIEQPVVSTSAAPGKETVVVASTTAGDQKPIVQTDNSLSPPKEEKPIATATTETHTPKHTVEILTNGSQTLTNYYSKDLNVGMGFNGVKPSFVELGHTSTLLNNNRDFASSTITGGYAFGSRFDASKTQSITDTGPYLSNQLYYDHKLGRTGSLNNTFLVANGGLSYQPLSHYNLQGYGALGLRQDLGNFSLSAGAGAFSANHLSPTLSPYANLNYKFTKTTSANVNWDGHTWTAGVGIHF